MVWYCFLDLHPLGNLVAKLLVSLGLGIIFDLYITKKGELDFLEKAERTRTAKWWNGLMHLFLLLLQLPLSISFCFRIIKYPTGSMENTLLIGDHLYVSKVAYGPRIPNTPLVISFHTAYHAAYNGVQIISWNGSNCPIKDLPVLVR